MLNVTAIAVFLAAGVVVQVEYPTALKEYGTWEVYLSAISTSHCGSVGPYHHDVFEIPTLCPTHSGNGNWHQKLVLAFAVGERTISTPTQLNQTLPFPVMYAAMMYHWKLLLVPVFRWQKRYNDKHGIVDYDRDFMIDDDERW